MTLVEFRNGTREGLHGPLLALWLDGQGKWEDAHLVVQDLDDADSALVHAYLHRKEGDLANAQYWYRRAGRSLPRAALDEEWEAMLAELIARS